MEITVKKDVIRGKVLLTADNEIELEGYGRLTLSDDFRIYKIYGELAMEKTNRILVIPLRILWWRGMKSARH